MVQVDTGNASTDGKGYRRGTHRVCHPGETFERLRALMPACGITRVANITGLDCVGVPVFIAVRPNSRSLSSAQGKGLDVAAARTSAMMEAFESWHGERVTGVGCYLRQGEVADAHGIGTIDVGRVIRRGAATAWATAHPLNWVLGRELLSGRPRYVPYDCASNDLTAGATRTPIIRSTNGLASGNTLPEATLHGIYEVVERDAVSRWRPSMAGSGGGGELAGQPGGELAGEPAGQRVVDLATITDDDNGALLERVRQAGLEVLIRLVGSDIGIPVVSAVLTPGPQWRVAPFAAFSGFGAHLDPKVALARAVTEAVQSRLTLIHGGRDDLWPSQYAKVLDHRAALSWAREVRAQEPSCDFSTVVDRSTDSFDGDLAVVLAGLRPVVDEVVVVDLTRAEIDIPVVKVVIPGLDGIPFDERPRSGGRGDGPSGGAR